ncbi:MAG: 23S rRNA (uracil(1939)-C(5))-methyltransferase RlmD [Pseudanabaenaceae cyanobacterium SKYGB_i_bin29]|nr:23S rRNA (uracil(1939)-C(5))-methyltransferase RlmD [Pseudanabaenaceae cyanobacterium SKYG29]MDW8420425.1 23S rRNA (uracil(1939)-C(5))-methyltransferase RlmD [Pseudanabaenaceae cyanobacterium SKYGB_i_bin29]
MLKPGDKIQLTISDLADNGCGVGRDRGFVIFVPNAVPGDEVLVQVILLKRNWAEARLVEIITPSPHRVRPRCIVADKCGGCQWQFASYNYQLQAKQNQVLQALVRIGKFPESQVIAKLQPIIPAPQAFHYRNKVIYPITTNQAGKIKVGYYQRNTHKVINLNQCPVQDERLDALLKTVKQDLDRSGWSIYNEATHQGNLRHIGFRIGRHTGEILITIVTQSWALPGVEQVGQSWLELPGVVGVVLNRNAQHNNVILGEASRCIAGRDYVREKFTNLELHLTADTFFQIYTEQAEQLVKILLDTLQLQGTEIIVDAYCGIGTFTLPLAQLVRQCYGIEIQPQAVQQAQRNATINNLTDRVKFIPGKVEAVLPQLQINPDILLLDPPRKGCEPEVIQFIEESRIERIIYISCNPATLARDLQLLCSSGSYSLEKIQPIDFFPQTAHVETMVLLVRS